MTTHNPHRAAATICRLALVGGALTSVAANVAHAEASLGARLLASVFPLFLIAAVEILVRVPWSAGWGYATTGYLLTLSVALGAAYVSYSHLSGLALEYGEPWGVAHTLPLAVDGFSTLGALGLLATERATRAVPDRPGFMPRPEPAAPPVPVEYPPVVPDPEPIPADGTEEEQREVPNTDPVPQEVPRTEGEPGTEKPIGTEEKPVPHEVLAAELLARYSEAGTTLTAQKLIDEMKVRTGRGVSKTKALTLLREARQTVA
jgi:hypothetical protein